MSHYAFPDNTADLLLLLAVATFAMVVLGGVFLQVITFHAPHEYSAIEDSGPHTPVMMKRTKSEEDRQKANEPGTLPESTSIDEVIMHYDPASKGHGTIPAADDETSSLLSNPSTAGTGNFGGEDANSKVDDSQSTDIRGFALLFRAKFWQLFILLGLLTGIGLMTIK